MKGDSGPTWEPSQCISQVWIEFSNDQTWSRASLQNWWEEAGLQHKALTGRGCNAEGKFWCCITTSIQLPTPSTWGRKAGEELRCHRTAQQCCWGRSAERCNQSTFRLPSLSPTPYKTHLHTGSKPLRPKALYRDSQTGLSGERQAELETHKVPQPLQQLLLLEEQEPKIRAGSFYWQWLSLRRWRKALH